LRGIAEDDLQRMRGQAEIFGAARLSRTADVVSAALDDMSGATSPRLHLELMVARVLAGASDAAAGAPSAPSAERAAAPPRHVAASVSTAAAPAVSAPTAPAPSAPAAPAAPAEPVPTPSTPAVSAPAGSAAAGSAPAGFAAVTSAPAASAPADSASVTSSPSPAESSTGAVGEASAAEPAAPRGPVTFDSIRSSWPAVLTRLEGISRTSWLLATAVQPLAYVTDTEVLTLGFTSQHDVAKFKGTTPGSGPSDHLRSAIEHELGVRVKYLPAPMPTGGAPRQPAAAGPSAPADSAPASEPASAGSSRSQVRGASASAVTEWAVAPIPTAQEEPASTPPAPSSPLPVDEEPEEVEAAASAPVPPSDGAVDRDEPPLPGDDEAPAFDDEPPYDPSYEPPMPQQQQQQSPPAPQSAPQRSTLQAQRAAAAPPVVIERAPSVGGVQRYGEAVIRQVLGATFLREEPYEPPTRFS
jgi:DNA polymerase-3 subunit gamma/tau